MFNEEKELMGKYGATEDRMTEYNEVPAEWRIRYFEGVEKGYEIHMTVKNSPSKLEMTKVLTALGVKIAVESIEKNEQVDEFERQFDHYNMWYFKGVLRGIKEREKEAQKKE